jgi:hypothetical protein
MTDTNKKPYINISQLSKICMIKLITTRIAKRNHFNSRDLPASRLTTRVDVTFRRKTGQVESIE